MRATKLIGMCGRFSLGLEASDLPAAVRGEPGGPGNPEHEHQEPGHEEPGPLGESRSEQGAAVDWLGAAAWKPSYNIAPTDRALLAIEKNGTLQLEVLSFGMVPPYFKGDARAARAQQLKTFNCRRETICSGHLVWDSVKNHGRGVVPAQGYYEWRLVAGDKQPYFVHYQNAPLIWLVAVYSHHPEHGSSFAIVTGPARGDDDDDILWLHARKPLMVAPFLDRWRRWLDPELSFAEVEDVLESQHNEAFAGLDIYKVGKKVGNSRAAGPELMKPDTQASIGLFFKEGKTLRTDDVTRKTVNEPDVKNSVNDDVKNVKQEEGVTGHSSEDVKHSVNNEGVNRESVNREGVKLEGVNRDTVNLTGVKTPSDVTDIKQKPKHASGAKPVAPKRKLEYRLAKTPKKRPHYDIANMVTKSPRKPK